MRHQLTIKPMDTCFKYLVAVVLTVFSLTSNSAELHDAVKEGNLEKVVALLHAGADANESDYVVGGPLFIAAGRANTAIVELLLERGADPDLIGESGDKTPLHQAILVGNNENIELLINASANIEKHNARGMTALHIAGGDGNLSAIKLLLEAGANIDAVDDVTKTTPLHSATGNGQTEAVKLLASKGAAMDVEDAQGRSLLHYATFPDSYSRVGDASLITYLFENGAPNVKEALAWRKMDQNSGAIFETVMEELERLSKL